MVLKLNCELVGLFTYKEVWPLICVVDRSFVWEDDGDVVFVVSLLQNLMRKSKNGHTISLHYFWGGVSYGKDKPEGMGATLGWVSFKHMGPMYFKLE